MPPRPLSSSYEPPKNRTVSPADEATGHRRCRRRRRRRRRAGVPEGAIGYLEFRDRSRHGPIDFPIARARSDPLSRRTVRTFYLLWAKHIGQTRRRNFRGNERERCSFGEQSFTRSPNKHPNRGRPINVVTKFSESVRWLYTPAAHRGESALVIVENSAWFHEQQKYTAF